MRDLRQTEEEMHNDQVKKQRIKKLSRKQQSELMRNRLSINVKNQTHKKPKHPQDMMVTSTKPTFLYQMLSFIGLV